MEESAESAPLPDGAKLLLEGGVSASSGVGAGEVFVVRRDADMLRFPHGAVLVVEQASDKIQQELVALSQLPGVDELHLVFANYEDDMDAQGHMECPAHQPRHSRNNGDGMPFGAGEQE